MAGAYTLVAGGQFRGDWFYFNFSIDNPEWPAQHIDHTDSLAIVLAAQHRGHLWPNYWVVIYSDNQPAAQIMNKGTTGQTTIMQELRALFWLSAVHNFHITAIYLEGYCNTTADAISRLRTFAQEHLMHCSGQNGLDRSHLFTVALLCFLQARHLFRHHSCNRKFIDIALSSTPNPKKQPTKCTTTPICV